MVEQSTTVHTAEPTRSREAPPRVPLLARRDVFLGAGKALWIIRARRSLARAVSILNPFSAAPRGG